MIARLNIQVAKSVCVSLIFLFMVSCNNTDNETSSWNIMKNGKSIEKIQKATPPDLSKAKALSIQIVDGDRVSFRGLSGVDGSMNPGVTKPQLPCIWIILSISDRNKDAAQSLGVMPNNSYIQLRDGDGFTTHGLLPKGKHLWHIKPINPAAAGDEQLFSEYANMLVEQPFDAIEVPNTTEGLIAALKSTDRLVRDKSAEKLGKIDTPHVVDQLIVLLKDNDGFVRATAVRALGERKDPRVVEPLIAMLKDNSMDVRVSAIHVLGKTNDPRAVEPLKAALKDLEAALKDKNSLHNLRP